MGLANTVSLHKKQRKAHQTLYMELATPALHQLLEDLPGSVHATPEQLRALAAVGEPFGQRNAITSVAKSSDRVAMETPKDAANDLGHHLLEDQG